MHLSAAKTITVSKQKTGILEKEFKMYLTQICKLTPFNLLAKTYTTFSKISDLMKVYPKNSIAKECT